MRQTTQAIVLSGIKYSESSLILNVYTKNNGKQSLIYRGFYNKKNRLRALLFPLIQVEITYQNTNKTQLHQLYEVSLTKQNLAQHNPYKNSILLFLSEVLNQVLKEEEQNHMLYQFLSSSLDWLTHQTENYANFHLWFLVNLSKYLGFYPNTEQRNYSYFDLEQGIFTNQKTANICLDQQQTQLFVCLLQTDLNKLGSHIKNQQQRQSLLQCLIQYYTIHNQEFKTPKSTEVLHRVFA